MKIKKFAPINERILVRPVVEERSDGLYVPPSATTSDFIEGEIVAMGNGAISAQGTRIQPAVNVGDKIYFEPRGTREVPGTDLVLMNERQIIGVINEPPEPPIFLPAGEGTC